MEKINVDIVFNGWGASTCLLINEMDKQNLLKDKKIAIIEPFEKKENNKTFCFWANENESILKDYRFLTNKSWSKIKINDWKSEEINPLKYYHIESSSLYKHTRKIIKKNNFIQIADFVKKVSTNKDSFLVETSNQIIVSEWVFDSRPYNFKKIKKNDFFIYQSFLGFKITLSDKNFDKDTYHMMDFRVDQANETQFIYILPYNEKSGLIELTRFGKSKIDSTYSKKTLNEFILKHYGNYNIDEVEKGVIPMSFESPPNNVEKKWVNIGTRAGAVKPSTGYAFKNMYQQAQHICENNKLSKRLFKQKNRFKFYDQLLLIILNLWPQKGKFIFERLYKRQSSKYILKFLDEKSNFLEEIKMFSTLQKRTFIKSLFMWMYHHIKKSIVPLLLVLYVLIKTFFFESSFFWENFEITLFIIGMILIGIPHGSLDHLLETGNFKTKINLLFILKYLSLMMLIFLIWTFNPTLWLLVFISFSAWHFGQTDIHKWLNMPNKWISFIWGFTILCYLFASHSIEFNQIISSLNIPDFYFLKTINYLSGAIIVLFILYSILKKTFSWTLTCIYLLLSTYLDLISAFAFYFVFIHSVSGWKDLKERFKVSYFNMFVKSIPFNLGALFLFLIALFFAPSFLTNWGVLFLFLSCISFPHVIEMTFFYKKKRL